MGGGTFKERPKRKGNEKNGRGANPFIGFVDEGFRESGGMSEALRKFCVRREMIPGEGVDGSSDVV